MPLDQTQPAAATFVFADIAGFTALTEAHGDDQAAHLVADFCDAVAAELPAFGGTQIKTIGDALMLRIADPQDAVLLGLRIAHDVLTGHGARSVRVGMHHGPAIERNGGYIGALDDGEQRMSSIRVSGLKNGRLVASRRRGSGDRLSRNPVAGNPVPAAMRPAMRSAR